MSRHYFSNGTEHSMWSARWCDRCEHDHEMHAADGAGVGGCELVLAMFMGEDRPELVDRDGLPPGHLTCSKWAACGACGETDQ